MRPLIGMWLPPRKASYRIPARSLLWGKQCARARSRVKASLWDMSVLRPLMRASCFSIICIPTMLKGVDNGELCLINR
jgi:hypothetical protein